MDRIKNTAFFLVISVVVHFTSDWLQSDFIFSFMRENLITLLLALMAINTTTVSVIMTKLREISDDSGVDFSDSITAMRESIVEQVVLLVIATVILIIQSSVVLNSKWVWTESVTTILLLTTFLFAVQILFDTAQGVFVIAHKENGLLLSRNKNAVNDASKVVKKKTK